MKIISLQHSIFAISAFVWSIPFSANKIKNQTSNIALAHWPQGLSCPNMWLTMPQGVGHNPLGLMSCKGCFHFFCTLRLADVVFGHSCHVIHVPVLQATTQVCEIYTFNHLYAYSSNLFIFVLFTCVYKRYSISFS